VVVVEVVVQFLAEDEVLNPAWQPFPQPGVPPLHAHPLQSPPRNPTTPRLLYFSKMQYHATEGILVELLWTLKFLVVDVHVQEIFLRQNLPTRQCECAMLVTVAVARKVL
jgi:hypothetical protein